MAEHLPASKNPTPGMLAFSKTLPFHGTRNPVTHTGRGFRAKFCSQKNRRMIRCESLLEMSFLFLAEFAKNVIAFDEQPVTISYRLDGRARRYTPDFVLHWADGRHWYVEVKPSERLNTEENQLKFGAIAEHFTSLGDVFITATELEIKISTRQYHVRNLLRVRQEQQSLKASTDPQILLAGDTTFGSFALTVGGHDQAMQLLAHREFSFNLKEELHSNTTITHFTEADDAALFI